MNKYKSIICNWCGQTTTVIWIHGHGQCSKCGKNVDECCSGEQASYVSNYSAEMKNTDLIKHICFDLDGTLVESGTTIYKAVKAALQRMNIIVLIPENEFMGMIGKHFNEIFDSLKISIPDFNEFISIYKKYYFNFINDSVLFPGVTEVFVYFKRKGIKTSLLTTKAQDQADKIVDHFGLREIHNSAGLNYVMGRRDGIAWKPSPEPLQIICDELKLSPAETLMVGDTELDIRCGKNAGAKTCGVIYGYRTKEQIVPEMPDFVIEKISDLKSFTSIY